MTGAAGSQRSFQTTSWTLLDGLRASDEQARLDCLDQLARLYWPPIYACIRRFGLPPEQAADLTQGFFSDVVLGRQLFDRAEQEQGRLRDLIRVALKRYLIDAHRSERKPQSGQLIPLEALAIEEQRLARDEAASHEEAFDRRWALALLQEALRRTEASFRSANKLGHWQAFEARVLRPATDVAVAQPLGIIAELYGFHSSAAVSAALQVVKKRLMSALRQVTAETTVGGEASTTELQKVLTLLGQAKSAHQH